MNKTFIVNVMGSSKKEVYIYPSKGKQGIYIRSLKQCISEKYVIHKDGTCSEKLPNVLLLLKASFKSDVFIISWIENVGYLKGAGLQFVFALLSILIVKLRRKKMIWILHNIHPHQGENMMSKVIKSAMFKYSTLIISHSCEASEYAKKNTANEPNKVEYKCHPILEATFTRDNTVNFQGVLYWGDIYAYKGVPEFLEYISRHDGHPNICVIGKCKEPSLEDRIKRSCNSSIKYINSYLPFETIAGYVAKSKYVIFPYIGDSISSSGVLMDTLMMGGTPLGPNCGAFRDLAKEGVCLVYNNYDEMYEILISEKNLRESRRNEFIQNNTWKAFGQYLSQKID